MRVLIDEVLETVTWLRSSPQPGSRAPQVGRADDGKASMAQPLPAPARTCSELSGRCLVHFCCDGHRAVLGAAAAAEVPGWM